MIEHKDAWGNKIQIGDIVIRLARQKYVVGKPEIVTKLTAKSVIVNGSAITPEYVLVVTDTIESGKHKGATERLNEQFKEEIEKNKKDGVKIKKATPVYRVTAYKTSDKWFLRISCGEGKQYGSPFAEVAPINAYPIKSIQSVSKGWYYKDKGFTHDFVIPDYDGKRAQNFLSAKSIGKLGLPLPDKMQFIDLSFDSVEELISQLESKNCRISEYTKKYRLL